METKTLTIEHIAPYLPYGIRMINTKSGRIIDVRGLRATVSTFIIEATVKSENGINDVEYQSDLWRLKPILRPLSDFNNSEADTEIYETGNHYTSVLLNAATDLPFWEVQILLKHHFDVFGLIDAGLAIDINSISHE